ncbi:hypothetical protein F3Y22_tig00000715pilonHSYRG00024 [Hibiscus syriacus]|uniref:SCP domain-containing protein n=1 Tax=Hibiscus syriacus TaxID=106335 RepID=A0A6A3D632_HIBSY|nr:hypothetical protein F3Y22_tig00000715pilonHSYRG00024 [Hibiscus syriacus]
MEMAAKFSYYLLGGFILLSSFVSLSSSYFDNNEISSDIVLRAELRLPPLRWSKKLAKFASWWAHKRQGDRGLIHSNSDYGENLFWGSGKDWKPRDAVAAWAAEKRNYNYKTNSCRNNNQCLHYTQMIWRNNLKIGCAKVVCRSGDTLISCNYDPHGNVVGQKPF